MSIWSEVSISDHAWRLWDFGPLALWARMVDDELHIATEQDAEDGTTRIKGSEPGEEAEVRRWILRNEPLAIQSIPVMPDRPVVVRPESPIRFPPGRKARIYVSIPVWFKIIAKQAEDIPLLEEPIRPLSNIWFGDPMDGVLAYSLKSRARRHLGSIPPQVYRALCPVTIHNISKEELDFQRICIRVEHLSIYEGNESLWSNEVDVRFRGQDDVSRVDYADQAPREASGAARLSEARVPVTRGVFKKSFVSLARLTGIYKG